MSNPKVSIVILNWNGLGDTLECLGSLQKITYKNFEIIIVDNASQNNEADKIKEKYPEAILIKNNVNEGFCRGCNIGAKKALENNSKYILFLNNDTIVNPNFLKELIKFMEADKNVAISGPLVFYYNWPEDVYSSGCTFNYSFFIPKEDRLLLQRPKNDLISVSTALLIRADLIKVAGLWDENFFSYWEDIDYGLRAKKFGFKIACVSSSVIYHKVSRANKYLSKRYIYFMVRNNLLAAKKHAKWYQWPTIILNFIARRWFGYFFKLTITKNFSAILAIFWGTYDFFAGNFGKGRYIKN